MCKDSKAASGSKKDPQKMSTHQKPGVVAIKPGEMFLPTGTMAGRHIYV